MLYQWLPAKQVTEISANGQKLMQAVEVGFHSGTLTNTWITQTVINQ